MEAAFQLMKPVRGIETSILLSIAAHQMAFQLMKPVRGIETACYYQSNGDC
jgi:hypothetical protein